MGSADAPRLRAIHADNVAAIRCYAKAGFRPVGVMRAAWRDRRGRWRDVLLMELVAPRGAPSHAERSLDWE